MKTLVTGGAGFIGSHLVERLLHDGHEVTVLDDLSTGRNLPSGARFIQGKIEAAWVACEGIDWVFHLAGRADIVPSITEPELYHRVNVGGTVHMLESARAHSVKRFIYAASSSCYGIPDIFPTPETAPIRPQYPYAFTKWIGEQYVLHWGQVYGLPVIALRLFNVYGPRARTSGAYGAVMGVFLAQKLHGQPLTIVGDGGQTRDFTYVTDVVNAFIKAAESDYACCVLNVGSGEAHSVNSLARSIGGPGYPVTYLPKRPGEPDCTWADISKIRGLLGWEPVVSFQDGVGKLLASVEDFRDAPVWTPESIQKATSDWFRYLGKD